MKTTLIFIIIGLLITQSCVMNNKQGMNIKDFVIEKHFITDTSDFISFNDFISEFDTIPNEFGYIIFNEIISEIPFESSDFKKLWTWDIERINYVKAIKSNLRLDSNKKMSDETYFFIINILTKDNISINSTIYIDFDNYLIGSYFIPLDSLKFVYLKDDIWNVDYKILKTIKQSP